jgi:hypothetical protein
MMAITIFIASISPFPLRACADRADLSVPRPRWIGPCAVGQCEV